MSNKAKMPTIKKAPENIDVVALSGDRIIFELIEVEPKKKSNIIDPNTGLPVEKDDLYDRYPKRGKVIYTGLDVAEKNPNVVPGCTIFLESEHALTLILINGEGYFHTRLSNIMLVYKEN